PECKAGSRALEVQKWGKRNSPNREPEEQPPKYSYSLRVAKAPVDRSTHHHLAYIPLWNPPPCSHHWWAARWDLAWPRRIRYWQMLLVPYIHLGYYWHLGSAGCNPG